MYIINTVEVNLNVCFCYLADRCLNSIQVRVWINIRNNLPTRHTLWQSYFFLEAQILQRPGSFRVLFLGLHRSGQRSQMLFLRSLLQPLTASSVSITSGTICCLHLPLSNSSFSPWSFWSFVCFLLLLLSLYLSLSSSVRPYTQITSFTSKSSYNVKLMSLQRRRTVFSPPEADWGWEAICPNQLWWGDRD